MKKTVDEAAAENLREFIKHGPGLRTTTNVWIVAKAPGKVLLGGLGAMGCGEMWALEEPRHRDYIGYDEAPTVADPGPDAFGLSHEPQ